MIFWPARMVLPPDFQYFGLYFALNLRAPTLLRITGSPAASAPGSRLGGIGRRSSFHDRAGPFFCGRSGTLAPHRPLG